jgi:hypothetical protein
MAIAITIKIRMARRLLLIARLTKLVLSFDQYHDLLAAIGVHIGLPMWREDLENYFTNTTEQHEMAVRTAQAFRAFSELTANTTPTTDK